MNAKKKLRLKEMLEMMDQIIDRSKELVEKYEDQLNNCHPKFHRSALNLIHYRALRMFDITELQKQLGNMGLSRLAKSQSHVMASLLINRSIIRALLKEKSIKRKRPEVSIKKGTRYLRSNAKALLGYRSKGRRTRIMVTMPSEAADDYQMVHDMVAAGMNCARINCAHDGPDAWLKMIENIRMASKRLKKNCQVAMDLGGPKIRTGSLKPGPEVIKFTPDRDIRGHVIHPYAVWMGPEPFQDSNVAHLPITLEEAQSLKTGDRLYFQDTRDKKRVFRIYGTRENGCWAKCFDTAYLETGSKLYRDPEYLSEPITIGQIPAIEQRLILHIGGHLRLHKDPSPGEPTQYDEEGNPLAEAHVSCTAPQVFDRVKVGEPVLFDDGKIEGVIREVSQDEIRVEILYAKEGGGKLKADKGINFPKSDLDIRGLTEKDKQDLEFVAKYADVVNMSFVNTPRDITDLIAELDRLDAKNKLGIILKIETQAGFNNLVEILLEAMQVYPLGVMIARGDLAVECGWENIGRVQEEILSICQAAHVTDIWATQVLENLAKKGIPSRAEITDAAMAQRADCVMLNKGPYIIRAIKLLDSILKDMEPYWDKNAPLHPMMELAGGK